MRIEEGIAAAVECKKRVRDVYAEALKEASNPVGRRVYQLLTDEEQQQIDYLLEKLEQWESSGRIETDQFEATPYSEDEIARCAVHLKSNLPPRDEQCELNILRRAMVVDGEVTEFLKKLKDDIPDDAREIFKQFIKIEEGHAKVLQAEIDSIENTGFWFDIREFILE